MTARAGWQWLPGQDWAHTCCVWIWRCRVSFSEVLATEERKRCRHTTQWHLIDRYVVVSAASQAGKAAGVNLPSQAPLTRVQGDTVLVSPHRTRPLADMAFDQDHQSILASSCEIAHMVSNLIYSLIHRALETPCSWEMHISPVSEIENYTLIWTNNTLSSHSFFSFLFDVWYNKYQQKMREQYILYGQISEILLRMADCKSTQAVTHACSFLVS